MITNPSDTTFTVPRITYELYADGVLLGDGSYSTEDISMPGRAAFYPVCLCTALYDRKNFLILRNWLIIVIYSLVVSALLDKMQPFQALIYPQ